MMQKFLLISLLIFLSTLSFSASSVVSSRASSPVLLAVGDIATCGNLGAFITAGIIQKELGKNPNGKLTLLGDIAYERGTDAEFKCFDTAYGQFKNISYPAPGNHEYYTPNAAGYYTYYGTRAGNPKLGYYTYKLGNWRIYVLNSNCDFIGGCDNNSPQVKWLKQILLTNPSKCSLAYWHHPRFSSGRHGNAAFMQDIWAVLAKANTEIVLAGHDHTYERFAPLDSSGKPNLKGIRSFVVGTGGRSFYAFSNPQPHSQAKQNSSLGVNKFTLETNGYSWEFMSAKGTDFKDSGTGKCY
jgi:acid phosphatase type 7